MMRRFGFVVFYLILVSLVVGATWSKLLWGYWFKRSSVIVNLDGANPTALSIYRSAWLADGDRNELLANAQRSCGADQCATSRGPWLPFRNHDAYYCLSECVFTLAFGSDEAFSLPQVDRTIANNVVGGLLPGALDSNSLCPGPGCIQSIALLEFQRSGVDYLAIAAELANDALDDDRREYREYLYQLTGPEAILVESNAVRYEIAGLEGFDWLSVAILFFGIGAIAILLLHCVAACKGRARERHP